MFLKSKTKPVPDKPPRKTQFPIPPLSEKTAPEPPKNTTFSDDNIETRVYYHALGNVQLPKNATDIKILTIPHGLNYTLGYCLCDGFISFNNIAIPINNILYMKEYSK